MNTTTRRLSWLAFYIACGALGLYLGAIGFALNAAIDWGN